MRKCIEVFFEKIFNPFLTDINLYKKISNLHLHQNVNLTYVMEQFEKHSIDPNKVNIGVLSKITFSEISQFRTLSTDDLFLILISFFMLITIILKYTGIFEKVVGKISEKTKIDIEEARTFINYFLGLVYIMYAFYMIKLVLSNKQYILTSRIIHIFTYGIAGITILISFFIFLFN
jgi:hypothetical protein